MFESTFNNWFYLHQKNSSENLFIDLEMCRLGSYSLLYGHYNTLNSIVFQHVGPIICLSDETLWYPFARVTVSQGKSLVQAKNKKEWVGRGCKGDFKTDYF